MQTLGERIRSVRKDESLSLTRLAEKTGYAVSYLSDVELDKTKPSLDALVTIAGALDYTVIDLLEGVDFADPHRQSLREQLAALAHEQWSGWMAWMLPKLAEERPDRDGWIERWTRQMNTPYDQLSEAEKDSDRAEADKVLALIAKNRVV